MIFLILSTLTISFLSMSIHIAVQENSALVVPWIIGFITFMALEVVAMVYSNVLRDHVNRVSIQSPHRCNSARGRANDGCAFKFIPSFFILALISNFACENKLNFTLFKLNIARG